jgi:predicted  nucleic acid-binding Zn-ribbon protein
MPSETNTDRINRLERLTTALAERTENQSDFLHEARTRATEITERLHELDKRLALVEREAGETNKRLDELHARRWDMRKILIGAIVGGIIGSILAIGAGIVNTSLDRWIGAGTTN